MWHNLSVFGEPIVRRVFKLLPLGELQLHLVKRWKQSLKDFFNAAELPSAWEVMTRTHEVQSEYIKSRACHLLCYSDCCGPFVGASLLLPSLYIQQHAFAFL